MKELYKIGGILNRGFVGQATYHVCLEKPCSLLDIGLTFDQSKQRFKPEEVTPEVIREFREACNGQYGAEEATEQEAKEAILGNCKTEIHMVAYLNGMFIGGIHKQLAERHMHFAPGEASEGCLVQDTLEGVLEVTVIVFNVIKDDTAYELTVCGE